MGLFSAIFGGGSRNTNNVSNETLTSVTVNPVNDIAVIVDTSAQGMAIEGAANTFERMGRELAQALTGGFNSGGNAISGGISSAGANLAIGGMIFGLGLAISRRRQ